MFELAEHIVMHTLEESIRLLPFLFVTYLLMEFLEHHTGRKAQERIRKAGKLGPIWGGLLGIMPQCGFSTAASSLYAGRVITVGTLIAVYLSTSDEMLPIMISEAVPASTIARILIVKVLIAMISGLMIELVLVRVLKQKEKNMDIHMVCEEEHCHCEDGMVVSALRHTIHIFGYIVLVTLAMNMAVEVIGEETLTRFFTSIPVLGEMLAALVGLIPNCASSVVITELYLAGMIGAGAMMAGLLVNAGVGVLVLLRLNRNWKQDSRIIGTLYGLGVFWGVVIQAAGIAF